MKILIGGFLAESNAYVDKLTEIQDFMITTGEACADVLYIKDLAKELNVELVPSLVADGRGGGPVTKEAFDYILSQFKMYVKKYQHEVDGMFFFFHGASNVVDLEGGSGDHALVREIRKIVGRYMPIACVDDPHGNVSQELVDNLNILRTFRHSPHTDRAEAHQIVFKCLVDLVANRREIHPSYIKVPILLGGERCVSTDEPLVSINKKLNEIEADPKILCCSYHIGYLRHDCDKCGAAVCVVPYLPEYKEYADEKAKEIYDFVWARHKEFHFTGYAGDPDKALEAMMNTENGQVFLTDSGDNVTAGANGLNTYVLKQILELKDYKNKNILIAGINHKELFENVLQFKKVNDHVEFEIGVNKNELSAPVNVSGTIISFGDLHHHYHSLPVVGKCCTVKLDNIPVTVVIETFPVSFAEKYQYDCANIDIDAYNFIVVKQGYAFPEIKDKGKLVIMSLTNGSTLQDTSKLPFKLIMRPMYPIDKI